jgi:predicted RNA-binding Zn ribbon-like protein
LTSYRDLLVWSERAGILNAKALGPLRRAAADRQAEATRTLRRARVLRDDLYQLLLALAAKRRPDTRLAARVADHWRAARRRQELMPRENGFELRLSMNAGDLDRMLVPIVVSAADLLTSDRLPFVRRCAECDWLFLDVSKNGTRRWCKSTCGNRARARTRYTRLRGTRQPRR